MIRLLKAFLRYPLGGQTDWNARLQASLRPDPQYLKRRTAAKRGWENRKRRV